MRKRATLRLQFASPEFEGLEVAVKPVDVDQFEAIAKLADLAVPEPGRPPSPKMVETFILLCTRFGSALASWNLEDEDGTPVPATPEGLRGLDMPFVMALVWGWLDALESYARQLLGQAEQAVRDKELEQSLQVDALG